MPPYLGIAVNKALCTIDGLCPRLASIVADAGQSVLPQRSNTTVRQGIVAIGFILLVQRNQRVVAVSLLHPLHTITRVSQNLLTGLTRGLVGLGVIREGCLVRLVGMVQINEIDGAESAVFPHLTNDSSYTIAVVGIVLTIKGDTIVAKGIKLTTLGYIPPHTLVHDGNEVVCLLRTPGLLKTFWHLHFGKQYHGFCPPIAVY